MLTPFQKKVSFLCFYMTALKKAITKKIAFKLNDCREKMLRICDEPNIKVLKLREPLEAD